MLLLVGLSTFSLFVSGVQGITCYVCVSELNGACAEPSNADGVVISTTNCDGGSCMLYKTNYGYTRGCSFVHVSEDCVSGEYLGYSAEICACNSNLCNRSVGLCPFVPTYIILLAISLAFKNYR
ncbi:uncharacterized protein LOC128547345 [Mercenaria mercenaria]|uniref:uncharacterized protein LOC128547345 n=1 Tax=Mercenaria mercenaria TaxID=6596 RepID=UPI00234F6DD0|nr:uncharacterized protein LOC128547345 [Mercenaria mercenaria]